MLLIHHLYSEKNLTHHQPWWSHILGWEAVATDLWTVPLTPLMWPQTRKVQVKHDERGTSWKTRYFSKDLVKTHRQETAVRSHIYRARLILIISESLGHLEYVSSCLNIEDLCISPSDFQPESKENLFTEWRCLSVKSRTTNARACGVAAVASWSHWTNTLQRMRGADSGWIISITNRNATLRGDYPVYLVSSSLLQWRKFSRSFPSKK